jgi:hypothetical protein
MMKNPFESPRSEFPSNHSSLRRIGFWRIFMIGNVLVFVMLMLVAWPLIAWVGEPNGPVNKNGEPNILYGMIAVFGGLLLALNVFLCALLHKRKRPEGMQEGLSSNDADIPHQSR